MADPAWVYSKDIPSLENTLDELAAQLHSKRREPSKIRILPVIGLSIGIFLGFFLVLSFSVPYLPLGTNAFAGTSSVQSGSGGALQFALIVAASGGVIPGITYAVYRDREIQMKNDELAALSLEMKYIRSKILTLKQDEVASRFDKQGTATAASTGGGGSSSPPPAGQTMPKEWTESRK